MKDWRRRERRAKKWNKWVFRIEEKDKKKEWGRWNCNRKRRIKRKQKGNENEIEGNENLRRR